MNKFYNDVEMFHFFFLFIYCSLSRTFLGMIQKSHTILL